MKCVCFYHKVDNDGMCSAAIVKQLYPECILVGVNYDEQYDFSILKDVDKVFIVDFSFKDNEFEEILNINDKVEINWIDHHKSASQSKYWSDPNIKGNRNLDKAGCVLTWEYLNPDKKLPEIVKLIGDRDIWKFKYEDTKPIHEWLLLQCRKPGDFIKLLRLKPLEPDYIIILGEGKLLLQRKEITVKEMASRVYPGIIDGQKAGFINTSIHISDTGSYVLDTTNYKIVVLYFDLADGNRIYSLRSRKVDVSEIAKKFGGGGHAGAAGFKVPINKKINEVG